MFDEKEALQIIQDNNLSSDTLRTWRRRREIPQIYYQERKSLMLLLPKAVIDTRIEKYGMYLQLLLLQRTFKAGQNDNYYMTCLYSLCQECESAQ